MSSRPVDATPPKSGSPQVPAAKPVEPVAEQVVTAELSVEPALPSVPAASVDVGSPLLIAEPQTHGAGLRTPGEPRREVRLQLGSEPYSPDTLFGLSVTAADALDGLAGVAEKALPDASPEYLRRLLRAGLALGELALTKEGIVLAAHEYGHAYAARKAGASSRLDYITLGEGVTMLEGATRLEQQFRFQVGGLNQSESAVAYLHRDSARDGSMTLSRAMLALGSAFDDTLYIAHTAKDAAHGDAWAFADPARWQSQLRELGIEVTYRHSLSKALLADLLSLQTWDALATGAHYVLTGERSRARTRFQVGGAELMGPDIALLRSIYGDSFRIMATVDPGPKGVDVEVTVRTQPDSWDVNALGLRLKKLDAAHLDLFGTKLVLSPYIGVSQRVRPSTVTLTAPAQVAGEARTVYDVGTDFRVPLRPRLAVEGSVGTGKLWDGTLEQEPIRAFIGLRWLY